MRQTGVRFLLEYGHVIDAVMPEADATALVRNFETGHLVLAGKTRLGGPYGAGGKPWALDLTKVVGCLVITFDKPDDQTPQFRGGFGSGLQQRGEG